MTRRWRLFASGALLGGGLFLFSGVVLVPAAGDWGTHACLTPMVQALEHYPEPQCEP